MDNVSIIIPYNKDRGYLAQACDSADGQGRIILSKGDRTVGRNVNAALRCIETPYFCILAEDDWLPPGAIDRRLQRLKHTRTDFIHSYGVAVHPDKRLRIPWTKPEPTLREMIQMNRICGGTTLYKTELVDRFGGWDESLTTAEEYEWHLRLISGGATLSFTPHETYFYRRHSGQKSLGDISREHQKKRQAIINEIKSRYR